MTASSPTTTTTAGLPSPTPANVPPPLSSSLATLVYEVTTNLAGKTHDLHRGWMLPSTLFPCCLKSNMHQTTTTGRQWRPSPETTTQQRGLLLKLAASHSFYSNSPVSTASISLSPSRVH
ncbi:hypothetical protein L1887_02766 [Cichorium endivia]|nr:hypothetical protein L1887_02766 [Cichorium endivia]